MTHGVRFPASDRLADLGLAVRPFRDGRDYASAWQLTFERSAAFEGA